MTGALDGIRVLDMSRIMPCAFCTMILGDMGADVINVEMPPEAEAKGAGFRYVSKEEAQTAAATFRQRNKRSISVNLKTKEGQQIVHQLIKGSDVLVESFRPGVLKKLGCDYETLSKINPRLVYCSLSGYGQTGPYSNFAGHDINYIAIGGALDLIGDADRLPAVPINYIADLGGAALHGVVGILLALLARHQTGQGQHVDVSYLDTAIYLTANLCNNPVSWKGPMPRRGAMPLGGVYPYYSVYETKDGGLITIGCLEPWLWENLCRALDRQDLAVFCFKPEHQGKKPSTEYNGVKRQLQEIFLTRNRDEWFEYLAKKDVCVGKVYSWDEVFTDPQVLHRNMLVDVEHPTFGKVKQVGIPVKLSRTPGSIRRAGPYTGEHTGEVLQELGYTAEAIAGLKQKKVIH